MTLDVAALIYFNSYLSVYLASFFSLPITKDGTTLNHEQVVQQLEKLTVAYECGTGVRDWYNGLVNIKLKVELSRYEEAIGWLKDLIFSSHFDKDRLGSTYAH